MAGKQSLQDVAHKLGTNLISRWSVSTGYNRLSQMEKLVREPFFLHLSFMALHQTQCSAVHTFTAEGGHVQSVCFAFICASLAY